MTEKIMSEEQYNEFLKVYTNEALANMIKADIHSRFPEPYAGMYCQHLIISRMLQIYLILQQS